MVSHTFCRKQQDTSKEANQQCPIPCRTDLKKKHEPVCKAGQGSAQDSGKETA